MGNIILTNSFINVTDAYITARSQATGYDKQNVVDLWHLMRRFRADDLTKSDTNPLLVFDFGAAQDVAAVAVIGVNFDKVRIKGHDSDLGTDWSAADFDSGNVSVSMNALTRRYQCYVPLTAFDYRYLAVMTPAATSAVGSYTDAWEVCKVAIVESATPLSVNMGYGYRRKAAKPYKDVSLLHGGGERVGLGDARRFEATLVFDGLRAESEEAEMWALNALDESGPVLFYENRGDTSAVYVCLRDDGYEGVVVHNGLVEGNQIRIRELV